MGSPTAMQYFGETAYPLAPNPPKRSDSHVVTIHLPPRSSGHHFAFSQPVPAIHNPAPAVNPQPAVHRVVQVNQGEVGCYEFCREKIPEIVSYCVESSFFVFLGRSRACIQQQLHGKSWRRLRITGLCVSGLINLTSRAVAVSSGSVTWVTGIPIFMIYFIANEGAGCITGNTLERRYHWSKKDALKASLGVVAAGLAAPVGVVGVGMTNLILKQKVSTYQYKFFKQNTKYASSVGSVIIVIAATIIFFVCSG